MSVKPTKAFSRHRNGYLAPSGEFYACKFYEHEDLSETLHGVLGYGVTDTDCQASLFKRGWWKLQQGKFFVYDGNYDERQDWDKLTRHQRDTIFDWCEAHNKLAPWEPQPTTATTK